MASVSRKQALQAFREATYYGIAWGAYRGVSPTDPPSARDSQEGGPLQSVPRGWPADQSNYSLCATALTLVQRLGPDVLEDRGIGVLFPKPEYLREALDVLGQMANWAEVYGFLSPGDGTVIERYAFGQQAVSTRARQYESPDVQLENRKPSQP